MYRKRPRETDAKRVSRLRAIVITISLILVIILTWWLEIKLMTIQHDDDSMEKAEVTSENEEETKPSVQKGYNQSSNSKIKRTSTATVIYPEISFLDKQFEVDIQSVVADPEVSESADEIAEVELPEPADEIAEAELPEPADEIAEAELPEPADEIAEAELPEPADEIAEAELPEPSSEIAEAELPEPSSEIAEVELSESADEIAEAELSESADEIAEAELLEQSEAEETLFEYDEDNVYMLAQIIYAEDGGVSEKNHGVEAMTCDAIVVLNRVQSSLPDFKSVNSIEAVLNQRNAYPVTAEKIRNGLKPSETALEVARNVLEMRSRGEVYYYTDSDGNTYSTENILWQTSVKPNWGDAKVLFRIYEHYYSVYVSY